MRHSRWHAKLDCQHNKTHSSPSRVLENRYLTLTFQTEFLEGLNDWIVQSTETAQVEVVNVDDPGVLLPPTDTGDEIIQQVPVTPGTAIDFPSQ